MPWKTILVPHDFSASANHAAALARDEAKAHGGTIVLLHVVELPHQAENALVKDDDGNHVEIKTYAVGKATTHLADLAARLTKDGATVITDVRTGIPVDQILDAAKTHGAQLIVMGTHGHTGIRHLIAGSTTEKIVRASTVPVLTIRHPG
jgi:nucleotide-binding universal stress UspA family protein